MLKRLRTKFIVTNTLYVGIVLILVFLLICFFTYDAHIDELEAYLIKAATNSIEETPVSLDAPAPGHMFAPTAHIVVVADPQKGEIIHIEMRGAHLEQAALKEKVTAALASENQTGDLADDMHFAKIPNPDGSVSIGIASTRPVRA